MSLEEKVGQLVFAASDGVFMHENAPELEELEALVREGIIGGLVFFRGEPFATASIANYLQDKARWPLLMASDYEWGAAFRVDGATRFPSAMAIGAGGREDDARFQAEVTAQEARAMGIHLALAPVVDLNVNPANSVINYRSYGEDPVSVGKLGAAFIQKAREKGLLATAKHFPGHGATAADSHVTLPILRLKKDELMARELAPFRAAIDAGVAAVMTAHIAVPSLDGRDHWPATFSKEIVEGVLREQMGFEGLIVTDALDMEGARERWWDGEVAVNAIKAGCDLLFVPPEPRVAWRSVVQAVRRGEIPLERIDRSVMRVLEAKARLNLHRERIVDMRDIPRRVGDVRFIGRVQEIADRAITLLAHRSDVVPFRGEEPPVILLVSYVHAGDRAADPSVLEDELAARAERVTHLRLSSESSGAGLEDWKGDHDVVLFASFLRTRSFLGRGDLPDDLVASIRKRVAAGKPVVFVSFGNPYILTELPHASALMAAYDFAPVSQKAAVRALFGEIPIGGKLPVTLSERFPIGHGEDAERRKLELEEIESPEDAGFSGEGLQEVERILNEAVRAKAFPGGVVVVGRGGKVVLEHAFGRLSYKRGSPRVRDDTLYDVASLTKVVVTTTLAMIFVERGKLALERPVQDYIPEFQGEYKHLATVADLLAHTSGTLWWKDFYRQVSGMTKREAKAKILADIYTLPLDYAPRAKSVYSDLGILLLGEILERLSGHTLDELAKNEIFEPLGMDDSTFNPDTSRLDLIAPTEDDPWRGRVVRGEVHDENAFVLGGVAPHAGLFSTGADLARFAQMMLNGGVYGPHRIVRRSTIERFTTRAGLVPNSSRALGWDTPSKVSSAGRYFSSSSYGHTGFTGTSIWIDPQHDLLVILLTNRVHPTRENRQIREIRPAVHDAVREAIDDRRANPRR
jgi:beta-glucosidase-like glycosyl hydrolase/CubicO group peptidase (beta-lactamase class C family)